MYRRAPARPRFGKNALGIIVALVSFLVVIFIVDRAVVLQSPRQALTYTQFYRAIEQDQVAAVTIRGQEVTGQLRSGTASPQTFTTTIAEASDVLPALRAHNVNVAIAATSTSNGTDTLVSFLPIGLMIVLLLFILRRARPLGR